MTALQAVAATDDAAAEIDIDIEPVLAQLDRIQGPGRVHSYRFVPYRDATASSNGRATYNGKPAEE